MISAHASKVEPGPQGVSLEPQAFEETILEKRSSRFIGQIVHEEAVWGKRLSLGFEEVTLLALALPPPGAFLRKEGLSFHGKDPRQENLAS